MVSLLIEVPDSLHQSLREYLKRDKSLDQDALVSEAIALFLQSQAGRKAA